MLSMFARRLRNGAATPSAPAPLATTGLEELQAAGRSIAARTTQLKALVSQACAELVPVVGDAPTWNSTLEVAARHLEGCANAEGRELAHRLRALIIQHT